jgi:hypothetical protein
MRTLIFILFSLIFNNQIFTQSYFIQCAQCVKLSKLNCNNCASLELENFTGLILKGVTTKDVLLHSPVRMYKKGRAITFIDVAGTTINTSLSNLRNVDSYSELSSIITNCFCSGTSKPFAQLYNTSTKIVNTGSTAISFSSDNFLEQGLSITGDSILIETEGMYNINFNCTGLAAIAGQIFYGVYKNDVKFIETPFYYSHPTNSPGGASINVNLLLEPGYYHIKTRRAAGSTDIQVIYSNFTITKI